ncbi:MAG: dihydropteroate synthase [Bacteroidales bacterium]|nr:dihydropteroate synthase [Bacteroidales bacterium]
MTPDKWSAKDTLFSKNRKLKCGEKVLDLSTPSVIGVLNVTPDSFYDGGRFTTITEGLNYVEKMIADGASIIDVGAASTRPGAALLPEDVELERLLPYVEAIRRNFPDIIISIDTYRANVASKAIDQGADMINDISSGLFDDKMFGLLSQTGAAYIMMHIKGTPESMQHNPSYEDVVKEILLFFASRVKLLRKMGVENIILDPGFGFGKSVGHNYEILQKLDNFTELGLPVAVGVSRKSMINKVLGTLPSEALNGTTVLNTIAILMGADILRVHDVKEAVETVRLCGNFMK